MIRSNSTSTWSLPGGSLCLLFRLFPGNLGMVTAWGETFRQLETELSVGVQQHTKSDKKLKNSDQQLYQTTQLSRKKGYGTSWQKEANALYTLKGWDCGKVWSRRWFLTVPSPSPLCSLYLQGNGVCWLPLVAKGRQCSKPYRREETPLSGVRFCGRSQQWRLKRWTQHNERCSSAQRTITAERACRGNLHWHH